MERVITGMPLLWSEHESDLLSWQLPFLYLGGVCCCQDELILNVVGMPQKKKLSLIEQNTPRYTAEHKLEPGNCQDRSGCAGAPRTVACSSPCNPNLSGPPAAETGDSLEISWKTFLSVLRSVEECSENLNHLVPQIITSQPALSR